MNTNNNHTYTVSGVSFIGLLQIAFIVLKLCGVIKWSWWLVLIPLWIDVAFIAIVLIVATVLYLKEESNRKRRRREDKERA